MGPGTWWLVAGKEPSTMRLQQGWRGAGTWVLVYLYGYLYGARYLICWVIEVVLGWVPGTWWLEAGREPSTMRLQQLGWTGAGIEILGTCMGLVIGIENWYWYWYWYWDLYGTWWLEAGKAPSTMRLHLTWRGAGFEILTIWVGTRGTQLGT